MGFREALGGLRAAYTIATVARTGSNHLCSMLTHLGIAKPTEHFHFRHPHFKDADLDDLLTRIIEANTVNGVFGSKMFPDQRAWFEATASNLLGKRVFVHDIFPLHRWVRLSRNDKVRQAISLYRARETNEWLDATIDRSSGLQIEYDYNGILGCIRELALLEASWGEYFWSAPKQHEVKTFTYEDMTTDPWGVVRGIAETIQVPDWQGLASHDPDDLRSQFRVQRDDASHEMARRFRAEFMAAGAELAA